MAGVAECKRSRGPRNLWCCMSSATRPWRRRRRYSMRRRRISSSSTAPTMGTRRLLWPRVQSSRTARRQQCCRASFRPPHVLRSSPASRKLQDILSLANQRGTPRKPHGRFKRPKQDRCQRHRIALGRFNRGRCVPMNRRPDQRILSPRRGLRSRNLKVDQRSPRRGPRSRNRKLDQRSPSQGPKRNLDPKRGPPNLSRDPRRNLHLTSTSSALAGCAPSSAQATASATR